METMQILERIDLTNGNSAAGAVVLSLSEVRLSDAAIAALETGNPDGIAQLALSNHRKTPTTEQ